MGVAAGWGFCKKKFRRRISSLPAQPGRSHPDPARSTGKGGGSKRDGTPPAVSHTGEHGAGARCGRSSKLTETRRAGV